MNFSFSKKFLTIILLIILITMGSSYIIQKNIITSIIKSESQTRLQNSIAVIENELKTLKQQLQENAVIIKEDHQLSAAVYTKNSMEISNIISTYSPRFPRHYIRIFDNRGELLSESFSLPGYLKNQLPDSIIRTFFDDDIVLSEVFEINNRFFMKTYATLRNSGENCGIALIIFPIEQDFADSIKTRLGIDIIIYSSTGKIAASTIFDSNGKRLEVPPDKSEGYLKEYKYLESYSMVIEALTSKNEIWKKEFGASKKIWYINLFFIVFASFFINHFAKKAIEPFNLLIEGLKNVKNGIFNRQITHNYKDEAGMALDSFNTMLLELKEKKEEEEQLARIDKISSIGKMAATLAHEIKNPLSAISMIITMYNSEFETIDFEKKDFELMTKEIARINEIIETILDFARNNKLNIEEKNIVSTVKDMVDFTSKKGLENNCKFEFYTEYDEINLFIDEKMLNQLFLNIIMNSIEASKNGTISVSITKKEQIVAISFRDNGCGMSEYELSRAIEPFYTTKKDGTGIGLAVVKNIIDIHSFTFDIKSQKGAGTEFILYIDLEKNKNLKK